MESNKKKRNTLSMSFYNNDDRILFLQFVDKKEVAIKWVESKSKTWTHAMVYDRKTREKLERIINEKAI